MALRLLLDAHLSGAKVGGPLRNLDHDVRSLDAEPELEGLDDESVLAMAAMEGRILVTMDVADFPGILREWASAGRSHAGVILVHGIAHNAFGLIVNSVARQLHERPLHSDWIDIAVVASRPSASG